MRRVFFDTWAWVAIAHRDDAHHRRAAGFYESFVAARGVPVTTDYVLAETLTLLRARTDPLSAYSLVDLLLKAAKDGKMLVARVSEERWSKALDLSMKYADRPDISFVDFSSFVTMKALGVREAFTADSHFEAVGMGFAKLF